MFSRYLTGKPQHFLKKSKGKSRKVRSIFVAWLSVICIIVFCAVPTLAVLSNEYTIDDAITGEVLGNYHDLPVYKITLNSDVTGFHINKASGYDNVYPGENSAGASCALNVYSAPLNQDDDMYIEAKDYCTNNATELGEYLLDTEKYEYSIFMLSSAAPSFLGGGPKGFLVVEWEKNGGDEPPAPTIIYGDLNGDKEITTDDAAMLYGTLRGTLTLTEEQTAAADVNRDGEITADDAALVYAYVRGQIISFEPVGN